MRGIIIYFSLFSFLVANNIDDEIERLKQENRQLETRQRDSSKQKELMELRRRNQELKRRAGDNTTRSTRSVRKAPLQEEIDNNLGDKYYVNVSGNLLGSFIFSPTFAGGVSFEVGKYKQLSNEIFLRYYADAGFTISNISNDTFALIGFPKTTITTYNVSISGDFLVELNNGLWLVCGGKAGLGGFHVKMTLVNADDKSLSVGNGMMGFDAGLKLGFMYRINNAMQIEIGAKMNYLSLSVGPAALSFAQMGGYIGTSFVL